MFEDDETQMPDFEDDAEAFGDETEEPTWLDDEGEETLLGEEEGEEEGGDNKTFLIAVAAIVLMLLLTLGILAAYEVFIAPAKRHAQQTQVAQVNAQNTAIAQALTATAQAASWTATPTITPTMPPSPTPKSATPTPALVSQPSPTPVVVAAATNTPSIDPTAFALTATAIYATNQAVTLLTPSPTALAKTGLGDQMGLPGLIALAALFIVIIFLARRLRRTT